MTSRFHHSPLGLAIEQIDWYGLDSPADNQFIRVIKQDFDAELDRELRRTRGRPRTRIKRVTELLLSLQGALDGHDSFSRFAGSIDRALTIAATPPTIMPRGVASRVAESLVDISVAVLPAGEQERYREEFHAEMYELGRREQVVYGARQLTHSIGLRRSLTPRAKTPRPSQVSVRTTLIIVTSLMASGVVGLLTFLSSRNLPSSVLAGVAAFGTVTILLHLAIG